MVQFVANTLPVDNSNLSELDGYKPINTIGATTSIESKYKNGVLSVKVSLDGTLAYKIAKIETTPKQANKLFQGDGWEQKLFKGDDSIKGSTAIDSLYGFNGDDTIRGRDSDDTIDGGKGNDHLQGDAGGDTISGGKGNDHLDGGIGVNSLTGGAGKDAFAFSVPLVGGNYSEITDFEPGKDTIELHRDVFSGIGKTGTLKGGQFFLASDYDGKAKSVIYDDETGNLYYSKDGGDISSAQNFGRIGNGAELDHKDFLIV